MERREYPRELAPPMQVCGECRNVVDVSLGGICLDLELPVAPGRRYGLILADTLLHHSKELQAEVVWYTGGRAGLQWVDLTDDQTAWLRERCEEWDRDGLRAQIWPEAA
jgi:hypothetical protein